ncbi:MAG TPA: hypothetical protein DCZ95_10515 [Verrucomicrobia bacterium]|nr:MAG: hypothetical protein A2X46_18630 [Lentisphaerae bacterium GWF2_57_35]HBA84515.1 hypothetical protein [Verrucomicrobiota bacterium]
MLLGLLHLQPIGSFGSEPSRLIERFLFASSSEARQAWQARMKSPLVSSSPDGLVLPIPFDGTLDRVCWDRDLSLNLAAFSSFELSLTCDRPEALRSLSIYFKSGNGWYIWNKPLKKAGRQTLSLLKGDFETEDQPAGWDRIDGIRISPWKGQAVDTRMILHSLFARRDSLLLVRGTASTRDAAARGVADKVTQRISSWLGDMGVAHGIVTDDAVAAGALKGASLAILPYNPYPTDAELKALQSFLQQGGRLMVFYGAEPRLAKMMHMKLGAYQKAEKPGRWASFAFPQARRWGVPDRIFQDSPNVFTIHPDDDSAEVIAWWEDIGGRRLNDPAWVASPQGLWMSHILMNDDMQNKRDLLVGLVGQFMPAVWQASAQRCIEYAGRIDSFRSLADAFDQLSKAAGTAQNPQRIEALLEQARTAYFDMKASYNRGEYAQVLNQSRQLRNLLIEAYGSVQQPKAREFRGVWDHDGVGWFPGDWDKTCRLLSENGITAIFPNMLWGGMAHLPNTPLPVTATAKIYGDQLAQCVKAARRYGLEVHVWMVCWRLDGAPAELVERMRKQGRLQVNAAGKTVPWLCPSHPQNVQLAIDTLKDVAERYDIDGIHLDYVRYSDSSLCFSPVSHKAFEAYLGKEVAPWPGAARPGGRYEKEFKRWRAGQITAFVRQARDAVKAVKPKIQVSAAVFGSYPDCKNSVGQDWGAWLERGYVDFVCPMNYTTDLNGFVALTDKQIRLTGARDKILPGIGITADESQLTPDQAIEQILAARRLGAPGWMLFDLSGSLQREILPVMKLGVTR